MEHLVIKLRKTYKVYTGEQKEDTCLIIKNANSFLRYYPSTGKSTESSSIPSVTSNSSLAVAPAILTVIPLENCLIKQYRNGATAEVACKEDTIKNLKRTNRFCGIYSPYLLAKTYAYRHKIQKSKIAFGNIRSGTLINMVTGKLIRNATSQNWAYIKTLNIYELIKINYQDALDLAKLTNNLTPTRKETN